MQKSSEAMQHPVGNRAALGTSLLIASKVFSRCVDVATFAVLARLLVPADFGLVAIAMSVVTIFDAVLELPIPLALMALSERTKAHFNTAFTLQLMRGAVLAAVLILLAWPLAAFYHDDRLFALLCVLSLAPVSSGLISPRMTEYAVKMDFRQIFVMEVSSKLVALVVSLGSAWWSGSYWSIALGTLASPLTWVAISYIFAPYFPTLILTEWNVFAKYLRWTTLTQLVIATNSQMDQLLLGRFVSRFELGAFSMALNLSAMPNQIFIGQTSKPLLVGFSLVRDDRRRLMQAYLKSVNGIVATSLPLLVGMCITAEPLIRVFLGVQWSEAVPSLQWLSLAAIPYLFIGPVSPLGIALNRPSIFFKIASVEFSFKLPLMLIGLLFYGIPGVLAVRLTTAVITMVSSMLAVKTLIGLRIRTQLFYPWRPVLSVCVMALALQLMGGMVSTEGDHAHLILGLAWFCGKGAVIYAGTLFLLWFFSGQPDGIETKVMEFLSRALHSAVRYRSLR
jgi:O-antigen/teichoic acid export membrane protein